MMQYSFFVSRRLLPLAFAGKVRPAACHTRAQAVKKLNAWFACRAGRQAACSAATTMVGPFGEALSPCACPVRQRSCMLFGDTVCRVVRQVAEEIVPEDVPDAAELLSVDALARKDFVGMCEGAADLRGKPGDASPLAEDDVVNAVDDVHGVCVFPFRPSQTVQVMREKRGYGKRGILTLSPRSSGLRIASHPKVGNAESPRRYVCVPRPLSAGRGRYIPHMECLRCVGFQDEVQGCEV